MQYLHFHAVPNQNILLFFFFNFSAFALESLLVLNPKKLFFGLSCASGLGSPLLKKLLWLAVGR